LFKSIIFLLFTVVLFQSCVNNYVPSDLIFNRYVLVLVEEGYGSGVILNSSSVESLHHVVSDSGNIILLYKSNKQFGKRIYKIGDLYLLNALFCIDDININNSIEIGEEIFWIQPIMMKDNQIYLFLNSGRISHFNKDSFTIDVPVFPGASGTGVFNIMGELIGIIDYYRMFGVQIAYGNAIRVNHVQNLLEKK